MKKPLFLLLWISIVGAAAPALGYQTLLGGPYRINTLGSNSGGGVSENGRYRQNYTIAALFSSPMANGPYTLQPGPIAAIRTARDDLSEAHVFPVPFEPSLGHTRITFTRLTANCTIEIYTLAGEKVKTLTKSAVSDSLEWLPVANEKGSPVASGVYLYVINAPNLAPRRGKLMIIR